MLQPRGAPEWPPRNVVTVLSQPFAITSFALALLMVFRTNSSYARCVSIISFSVGGALGWLL